MIVVSSRLWALAGLSRFGMLPFKLLVRDLFLCIISLPVLLAVQLLLHLPFHISCRILSILTKTRRDFLEPDEGLCRSISLAVGRAGRFLRGAKCLPRAVTGQILLISVRRSATLRIGVIRRSPKLHGHAWLESGGTVLVGNVPDLQHYKQLPFTTSLEQVFGFYLAIQKSCGEQALRNASR